MSRWIRKTPLLTFQTIPVRTAREVEAGDHECDPPGEVDAGPRSVWECDCGERWRIAIPYWRSIGTSEGNADVPAWVRGIADAEGH